MEIEDPVTETIVGFLARIGIPVTIEPVAGKTFIPGAQVRDGGLVFDPMMLPYPGDLLHEAGHIAVTDPALRPALTEVSQDPGEEMAAIAWSYAAALEAGVDPAEVFHPFGYKGESARLLSDFTGGRYVGLPMLEWFGMTAAPGKGEAAGLPEYPAMARWLR
ncbi:hypothetical protein ACFQ1E_13205 [Sphingomonas canadensis]|uniref:IrrE N-terminal-like domain-containing protein n=1 Tax=Sphingomonas canadensis TaxID=1219257 RepID=A0ABW3HCC3_9SPHN|nr:hypothetical protein [Sphingomonas canadensis]MCW3837044.1 hypothetical protein [Sphingomonas canadensis]